jgi:hypothetical protein
MIQERQAMVRIARRVMIAVGFATVFSTARSLAQASRLGLSPPDLVRSIENYDDRPSIVVLNGGQQFQTTLYEVKVLATLSTERKTPYLVMAGRGCMNCDANTSVYIHSPSDGPMRNEGDQRRHSYPGRLVSYLDGKTPVAQTRMFIGDCVAGYANAVVWYLRERDEHGKWQSGVLIVSVRGDTLSEVLLRNELPPVSQSLQRARKGACKEVPGINGFSEP